eukprot:264432-Prymnesium_polylepis.1
MITGFREGVGSIMHVYGRAGGSGTPAVFRSNQRTSAWAGERARPGRGQPRGRTLCRMTCG